MEILIPFLNRDELSRDISSKISNILTYQNDTTKDIEELTRLLDALPANLHLNSIPIAGQFFDYLIQTSPSIQHYRLLSACLNFMKPEDRLLRVKQILQILLDNEQTVSLRELLCKLLMPIDTSTLVSLKIDWLQIESAIRSQHDPKFLVYIWRFLSKHYQKNLEEILVRTLPILDNNDELLLLLLIDLPTIQTFLSMPTFWYLIQRSLTDRTSNNDRVRKCALFLFKQILTDSNNKRIEIKEEKYDRLLVFIDEKSQSFWVDFIVLYEALEDGIVHLIKPLLNKFDRLHQFSLEQSIFSIEIIFD